MRKNRICAIVMSIALTFGTLACYAAPTASPAPSASPAASASPAPSASPEREIRKRCVAGTISTVTSVPCGTHCAENAVEPSPETATSIQWSVRQFQTREVF